MLSKVIWSDQIPEKDGVKVPINDIALSPGWSILVPLMIHLISSKDGSKIVAAVGNRVLLYMTSTGDLIDSLRGNYFFNNN